MAFVVGNLVELHIKAVVQGTVDSSRLVRVDLSKVILKWEVKLVAPSHQASQRDSHSLSVVQLVPICILCEVYLLTCPRNRAQTILLSLR